MVRAEFTGPPPSEATLQIIRAVLAEYAAWAKRGRRPVLRSVIVSNQGVRFRTGHCMSEKFCFVFDSQGGYGRSESNDQCWAFQRMVSYVLLAMKAELGDRMSLSGASAESWLSWAEPCSFCTIDVGRSRLLRLFQRKALFDPATTSQYVRRLGNAWLFTQMKVKVAYDVHANHQLQETRAFAEEDYDASNDEASDRPVHVPKSVWADLQHFAEYAPNPANLLDYRLPLHARASKPEHGHRTSFARFLTTPSSVIRVGRVNHLCVKSDSGAVCFRVLDPTAGDGVDVPWLKKLTRHKLIPFDEFLHVCLNLGLSVTSLLQERLMRHLKIRCPEFPELNRSPKKAPFGNIQSGGLWMRESDACSSPHRRVSRMTPVIASGFKFAVYAFNVHHNSLFLIYVALLSLCTYGLLTGAFALAADERLVNRHPDSLRVARWTGVYLLVVGSLFTAMWLSDIGKSLVANRVPAISVRYAVPTFAPYVLDLAFALPALILSGIRLIQQQQSGFVGGGLMLISTTLMMLQLATGTVYQGYVAGSTEWASAGLFVVLACLSGWVSSKFFGHCIRSTEIRRD